MGASQTAKSGRDAELGVRRGLPARPVTAMKAWFECYSWHCPPENMHSPCNTRFMCVRLTYEVANMQREPNNAFNGVL